MITSDAVQLQLGIRRARRARKVSAADVASRVTVSYRDNGDPRLVVELVAVESHPGAQAVAARVVPGNAGLMDARARGLSHDEQARRGAASQHRARSQRQMSGAYAACPDFLEQCVEFCLHVAFHRSDSYLPLVLIAVRWKHCFTTRQGFARTEA